MRIKNILLALIFLGFFNTFSQNAKLEKAVKKIQDANPEYIEAIKIYEKVIEEGRLEDHELFVKIASYYYFKSNYRKAVKWFDSYYAVDSIKPLPIHDYWYGQSLKTQNNYKKADSLLAPYYQNRGVRYIYSTENIKDIPKNDDRYEMLPFDYNTSFSDYSAYLHKDRFYFITNISNGNRLGWLNKNTSDIFFIDDSSADVKKPYGDLNSKYNEGSLVITKDGKTMYFTRNAFLRNKYKKTKKGEPRIISLNIYRAERVDFRWVNVTSLSINNPNYSVGHPALSADEKTLYFSSDMPGGKGLTDLYSVPIKKNGSLGKPVNLSALNTIGREMFPFVDKNTNTLYFSSDRPSSSGGLDVYISKLASDGSYKEAYNIGTPINSSFDDFGYMINDSKKGYFSSNRQEIGVVKQDRLDEIYSFIETKPFTFSTILAVNGTIRDVETGELAPSVKTSLYDKEDKVVETVFSDDNGYYIFAPADIDKLAYVRTEKEGYLTSDNSLDYRKLADKDTKLDINIVPVLPNVSKTFSITGKVLDENLTKQNRELAAAQITLYDINGNVMASRVTGIDGTYRLVDVNRKTAAFLRAEKEGYLTKEVAVNGNKVKGDIMYLDVLLSTSRIAKKAGEDIAFILNTIYFDYNKSNIRKDAEIELEKIVQVLKQYTDVKIHVGSHTDSRGAKSYNQKLSQRRAKSTYNYLVSRGINSSRLTYQGYGESELINECSDGVECSEEEYQLNRRSSFTIRK